MRRIKPKPTTARGTASLTQGSSFLHLQSLLLIMTHSYTIHRRKNSKQTKDATRTSILLRHHVPNRRASTSPRPAAHPTTHDNLHVLLHYCRDCHYHDHRYLPASGIGILVDNTLHADRESPSRLWSASAWILEGVMPDRKRRTGGKRGLKD